MRSIRTWLQALLAVSSLFAGGAIAQTYDHSVYLDLDNNAATGCSVTTAAGAVTGAEARISATVSGTPPMVTATTRAMCSGGVFGAAQPQAGNYAVGLNNGTGGSDVIELGTSLAGLGQGGMARLVFVSSSPAGADQASGNLQLPGFGQSSPVNPIMVPSTGIIALLLLAGLVLWLGRKHPGFAASAALVLLLGAGVAWAANFVVDGQVADWTGVQPLASDPANDSTSADAHIELVAVFAATEAGNLFMRFDVQDAQAPGNNPPVANDINFSVAENAANGAPVGTVAATDPNVGQALTYAITAGNAAGAFAINASTGAITVANGTPLNFETTPNFTLTVTVTDNGTPPLSDTATVVVSLTDVNEAPVLADATRAVAEDSPAGTQVGAPLGGSDPDAGDPPSTLVYAITAGNTNGAFAVSNTGQLTVANAAAITSIGTFTLTVTVTDDSGLSDPATVVVNVTDQNDAPQFTGAPYAFSLAENSAAGTAVGNAPATDTDAGQVVSYAITGGNTGGAFAISASGQITVANAAAINFEATPGFTLTLTATDNGTPPLSATTTATITITDVNEAPTANDAAFAVPEGAPVGTSVGGVVATDPDTAAPNSTLAYAITAGNTGNVFAINATTGVISTAGAPALANSPYTLTVTVTDGGAAPLSDIATVVITVTDQNDAPTLNDAAFALPENSANGTAVGTVTATDPDAGQTFTYAITAGNAAGGFAINPATGAITVANSAVLDFETTPAFVLTVSATDNGAPPLGDTAQVTITLTNANDAPVAPDAAMSVAENAANATVVGTYAATDPDAGQVLSYAITAGNTGGAFAINAAGQVTVANTAALNFETTPSFALTITATDNGAPVLSDTGTLTITLNDVNEAPVAADAAFNVAQDSASGTPVGTVTATDVDAGANGTRTFAITAGNTGTAFAIDANSGAITVQTQAQMTVGTVFNLTVTVTDGGAPGLTDTAAVTITVTDINEAPAPTSTVPSPISLAENTAPGTSVTTIVPNDPDAGNTHTFAFQSGNTGNAFAISPAGVITVAGPLDFEGATPSYVLTVRVTDNGAPPLFADIVVTVNLTNVNEAPVVAAGGTLSYQEGDVATAIDAGVTVADPDAGEGIESATVQITANYANGQDVLALPAQPNITGVFNAASGTLTLTGSDTPAAYQAALRAVTYFNTSGSPSTTARTVTWIANDNPLASAPVTSSIVINSTNSAPTIDSTAPALATEDTLYTYNATRLDSDGPSQAWNVEAGNTCAGASIVPATGVYTFTPAGPTPPASCVVAIRVCDGGTPDLCATQSTTITIAAVNDPPVIDSVAPTTATEDQPYNYAPTFVDADGTGQTWALVAPTHTCAGSINAGTGAFSFTPAGPTPPASCVVAIQVCDNGPLCSQQNTTVTITPVNSAPTINSVVPTTATEDALYTYNATRADLDGPAQAWTVLGANTCTGASIVAGTGVYTFTPTGPVPPATCVVAIEVCDNGSPNECAQQSATVNITAVNDAPVIDSTAPTTATEDTLYTYNATIADPDGPAQAWTVLAANTCAGSIGGGTGIYTFTPTGPNPPPSCTVAIQACDTGSPNECTTQSTVVTITGVNDGPANVVPGPQNTNEDTNLVFSAGNANQISIADGDAATMQATLAATNGLVTLAGTTGLTFSTGDGTGDANMAFSGTLANVNAALATLTFAPTPNFFGNASLTVGSNDGGSAGTGGALSDSDVIAITVVAVNDPPVALDEGFDTFGNTELRVDLGATATPHVLDTTGNTFGVRSNDTDPVEGDPTTVTSIQGCADVTAPYVCTLASGSIVTMNADGRFTFVPGIGLANGAPTTDSFTYVLTDAPAAGTAATDTGLVTISAFDKIWYVRQGQAGNGTSNNPLGTFSGIAGAGGAGDGDGPGDYIFVHHSAAAIASGIELEANQRLLGEGFGLQIARNLNGNGTPVTLVAAGTRSPVTNAGNVVSVTNAVPVEIRGLALSATGAGNAIDITTAAAALSGAPLLTIDGNQFGGAGAEGIDANVANTGLLTLAITNNAWVAGTHTGNAIDIANTSAAANSLALDLSNNTNLLSNASGIVIASAAVGRTTITGLSGNTVAGSVTNNGISIGNVTFDQTVGGAIQQVSGGNTLIGTAGDAVGGSGLAVSGSQGDLRFGDLDVFSGAGTALLVSGAGTGLTFGVTDAGSGGTSTLQSTTGPVLDASTAAIDLRLASANTSTTTAAVTLATVTGQFAANAGSLTKTSGAGTAFSVAGSNIVIDLAASLNVTAGSGVSLTTNTGSSITFRGGTTISTAANPAFVATGGGSVRVCDDAACNTGTAGATVNTLATTTATALNVANTTINGGLEFRSITSTGGANAGIVLNATGAGGLKVRANAGTCTSAGTCTGGAITGKTVDGITLNASNALELNNMFIDNNDGSGIFGDDVTGLVLANSRVTNNSDTTTGTEANLRFNELLGTVAISNSVFSGGPEDQIRMTPASGTLVLTMTGGTIGPGIGVAGNGFTMGATGTANVTVNINGTTFTDLPSAAFIANGADTASRTVSIVNSNFADSNNAVQLQGSFDADLDYSVSGGTYLRHALNPVQIVSGTTSTSALSWTGDVGTIAIGDGTADSGAQDLHGIAIEMNGDVDSVQSINGNNVRNTDIDGIFVQSRLDDDADAQTGRMDLTVRDNTTGNPDDNSAFPFGSSYGTRIEARNTFTACLDMFSNTASSDVVEHFRVRQRDTSIFRVERLTDGDGTPNELITNMATVEAHLVAQNDPGSTVDATQQTVATGFHEIASGACRKP